jgi:hypothetical protein
MADMAHISKWRRRTQDVTGGPNSLSGVPLTFNEPSPFLPFILQTIQSESDIVCFTGPRVQELFDTPLAVREGLKAQVSLSGKTKTRFWSDIASMVNQSAVASIKNVMTNKKGKLQKWKSTVKAAVHVHNQHKLGDLLQHIILQYTVQKKRQRMADLKALGRKASRQGGAAGTDTSPYMTRDEVFTTMDMGQPPIVITNSADENWGFLSTGTVCCM